MSTELIHYDAMCREIEAAHEIDEVRHIRNKAIALEAYAKQALNFEAEKRCREIRRRAERKAGELLAKKEKAKGARGSGSNQYEVRSRQPTAPTLAELGITKDQSSNWQKLALVPEAEFEAAVAEDRVGQLLAPPLANPEPVVAVGDDVLWLCANARRSEPTRTVNLSWHAEQ